MTDTHGELFVEEATELLAELETSLLELEKSPEDSDLVGRIFRAMHTIKGSGAMFGFDEVAGFTHSIESAYDLVRNGKIRVTKMLIDLTLKACDELRGMIDPDSGFSGGLLHDIGKIIVACYLPEQYKLYKAARAADPQTPDYELEERTIGFTHNQVGSLLAVQWKLPQKLNDAITYHHDPKAAPSGDAICYLVHIADFVAKKAFYFGDDEGRVGGLDATVREYMQVDDGQIDSFCELLKEEYVKAETFMQMAGIG